MIINALFVLFILLQIADAITTWRALQLKGTREANPVLAWLFKRLGIRPTLVITKLAAIAAVWFTMGPYSLWILVAINLAYIWAVWNNNRLKAA